jgi:hypothetical protein
MQRYPPDWLVSFGCGLSHARNAHPDVQQQYGFECQCVTCVAGDDRLLAADIHGSRLFLLTQ